MKGSHGRKLKAGTESEAMEEHVTLTGLHLVACSQSLSHPGTSIIYLENDP